MILDRRYNIWENSASVAGHYVRRAKGQAAEMDAHAQAVEILAPLIEPGMTLLDAGCGAGYLFHSFRRRGMEVEYYGLDFSPTFIDIGREHLQTHGLDPERLTVGSIENIIGRFDAVVCLNTLSFLPDWRLPLDRLCAATKKFLLIRTNLGPREIKRWEIDGYLNPGANHLKTYWNVFCQGEFCEFIQREGFEVRGIADERTGGQVEFTVGKPYWWKFVLAKRREAG